MPQSLARRGRRQLPSSQFLGRRARLEPLEDRTLLSINVTQYRYDGVSSGSNPNETSLTPDNVVAGNFTKIYNTVVDGQVLAQPLVMSGLNITTPGTTNAQNLVYTAPGSAGVHNVAFVATENDSLYAIDADTGVILWQDSFTISSASVVVNTVTSGEVNSGDISPEIGITGTPAIDPTTGFLYVVAKTQEIHNGDTANPHYVNTLYKVDIHDGTATSAVIADTTYNSDGSYTYNSGPYVLGTGDGYINVAGQNRVYFNSLRQMFRPAVELVNGQVILGSASHGDNGPYHGWMLTYSENDLSLTGVLCTSPNSGLAGIWQGGDGIVSDPEGYFYFQTGNGPFNQDPSNFNAAGFPIDGDYGDSFVKVAIDPTTNVNNQNVNGWGLKVVDYFTPYNQATLNDGDVDLGSGGPTILPDSVGSAAHPHLLIGGGKQGTLYLIDRDNMGKFNATTDQVVQEQANAVGGILSTPAYFNGSVYVTSSYGGSIEQFTISNGHLTTNASGTVVPISQTPDGFGNLDGSPTISSDGTANGVLWALDRGTGQLRAYDAANLGSELYTSAQLAGDQLGSVMKYTVPVVANGDVFVGTGNSLAMYSVPAPPTTPPNAPTNLTTSTPSAAAVQLNWTDNSNNESAFLIERSTDGVNFAPIGNASVNATQYIDYSVQAFTTYYYEVIATNIIGNSAPTNIATATTQGQPAIGAGDGLRGEYYAGNMINLATSTPILTRVDPTVNFNWDTVGPDPSVGQSNFEVNWTGEVQAQYSEAYTFSTVSDDGVELYVNGQLVINDFTYHGATTDTSAAIQLQAGQSYSIQMVYFQGGGQAVAQLFWASAHTPTEIIPQSQLFSGTAPAGPTDLQGVAVSGTQINLTWTTNSTDEDGYEVDRFNPATGSYAPVAFLPPGSNSYMDTGLVQGTSYQYQVRATNFVSDSAWSNTATVDTPTPPATPSNGHPTTITTTSISLAWQNNADNATAIRIFRNGLGSAGSNFIFVTSLPPTATSYVDNGPNGNGLTPGTNYDYHIQAGNLAGYTDFTGVSIQTLTNAPSKLTAVPANGQVSLAWKAPAGAVSYNIYRGSSPGGESATPLATNVLGDTFVDTSATNGTTYYYEVSAVDTGGESARSAEATATPQLPSAVAFAPQGLTATPGDQTVNLLWQAASGASSYNIYRGTASGAEMLVRSGVTSTSYNDTGLTDGVPYYYKVTSVNVIGEGQASSEVTATPNVVVPQAPINVNATPGDGLVNLSWSAAADALTYNIYRSTAAGDEVIYQQGISGTSFTDNSVTDGVTYYYQVSAGNGVGESNLSVEVMATPLPPLPATPAGLTAVSSNSSQIALSWSESSTNVTSYQVERSTDGTNFAPLTTLDGTATSYVDSGDLVVGTTYYYEIVASNLAGSSAPSSVASTQPLATLPPPWSDMDIGGPGVPGSASFADGSITVVGGGADIWNASDQFNFAYQTFNGDGTIIARVGAQGDSDPWAKGGVMFRNTLDANSAWALMALTPGNGATFQSRDTSGNLYYNTSGASVPDWVELVRSGSTFTGYVSTDGVNWTMVGSTTIAMNTQIYVGLADTAHNNALSSTDVFNDVSINGGGAPAAPVTLSASPASGTSVTLNWSDGDDNGLANMVYRQDPGMSSFLQIATVPAGTTTFTDTGLAVGQSYSYVVMTSNTVGTSNPSNPTTVTTPVPPLAVSVLQSNSISTTSAGLSWVLNSSNDTNVVVSRRSGGTGSFTTVATLPAGTQAYVDPSLQPGTLYEYHVSAINLAGASTAADTGATTLPLAPTEVSATAGLGQVQLTWTASTGAVAYNIYRGLAAGGEGAAPYATVNNATVFTDTGVNNGQIYYYYVTAVDFSGESVPSSEVHATVVPAPQVTQVMVAGTSWSAAVQTYLSSNSLGDGGYAIPTGSSQLRDLPWTNLNEILVQFSQPVNVTSSDLTLNGVNVPSYAISGFSYNSATNTATWTTAQNLKDDKINVGVSGAVTAQETGLPLNGAWTNGASQFPSGNGTASSFNFQINVLAGDINGDGVVSNADAQATRPLLTYVTTRAGYSIFDDLDANGVINATDALSTNQFLNNTLPTGVPATIGNGSPAALPALALPVAAKTIVTSKLAAYNSYNSELALDAVFAELGSGSPTKVKVVTLI